METGHGFRGGETEAQTLRQNVAANEGQGGQAQDPQHSLLLTPGSSVAPK